MGIASTYEGSVAQAGARSLEQERGDRERQIEDFELLLESVEAQNLQRYGPA